MKLHKALRVKTKSENVHTSYSYPGASFNIPCFQNAPTYGLDHINPSDLQTSWDL